MCKSTSPSIFFGTFNSESFWKNPESSSLPSVKDKSADLIVDAMDELMFVFSCQPNDLVITRFPMNSSHKTYLDSIGFKFLNNILPLQDCISYDHAGQHSICDLLMEKSKTDYFKKFIEPASYISPYSILPPTKVLCSEYGIKTNLPEIEVVRKVNSKVFSHTISKNIYKNTVGKIVNSANELCISGNELLQKFPFVIKDALGVSGNGNIIVNSELILKNIVKYLTKQENQGKQSQFLIEPFLKKKYDFSCQFEISEEGTINIISVQEMRNNGFTFSGLYTASRSLLLKLEKSKYFNYVADVSKALYKEGYFGYVCLDSMVLDNNQILPIIEINARKSMGLINYHIDLFLTQFSKHGNFISFTLCLPSDIEYEDILQEMEQAKILFNKRRLNGILPLSANTLFINRNAFENKEQKQHKGRFYASLVAENHQNYTQILNKLKQLFFDMNIKLFN